MPQLSLDLTEGVATVTITNPPLATMDPGTAARAIAEGTLHPAVRVDWSEV